MKVSIRLGVFLEIEIYNHQGDPQQSLYNIYEQNDLLLIRYPLKDKVLNVHIGVINTFIRELFDPILMKIILIKQRSNDVEWKN